MSGAARMLTLDIAGETYRAPRMSALEQFDCLQVATPLLAGLQKKGNGAASVDTVVMGLAGLSEDEVGKLLNRVLAPVERLRDGAWEPFWDAEASDAVTPGTDLATIGLVAAHVLVDNLAAFFSYEPAKIERRGAKGPSFKPVSLPGGRSWLLRPALRGVCRFESLVDGTLDLSHVALMNDALSADAENESRARKAAEDARAK